MSSEILTAEPPAIEPPIATPRVRLRRRAAAHTILLAHGEPLVWLTGGALAVAIAMILALLLRVFLAGVSTFWPGPLEQVALVDGSMYLGEVTSQERYRPSERIYESLGTEQQARVRARLDDADGNSVRRSFRTGNYEITGTHFTWIDGALVTDETQPEWAVVVERFADIDRSGVGRFYGLPAAFLIDGEVVAEGREAVWEQFLSHHDEILERREQVVDLEKHRLGATRRSVKNARLALKEAELEDGVDSSEYAAAQERLAEIQQEAAERDAEVIEQMQVLNHENLRFRIRFETASGDTKEIALADIVRAYPANQLSFADKASIYLSRWREFLFDDPRQANSEGGVYPAIWGTVAMTLIMSVLVVPFGVLAALYLREYAKGGPLVSAIRIAINNLAGVPSIVFGVFGLGFFCYVVGASIDQLFFRAQLAEYNAPTFGTGGVMWASFTLALLTLPVVIVATEEALAAVPNSMREGSYACGASKWQTIRRIVMPRAMPGIMTGMILAMARGAGEVAPLMLVGVVKIAPDLPVDGVFPFVHPERSFMHLGFHIYDVGFQSQNSEAAKPMVYTTTLLLISLIALLNIAAAFLRTRLRRKFVADHF
jgi:phosphate transport system permease protein